MMRYSDLITNTVKSSIDWLLFWTFIIRQLRFYDGLIIMTGEHLRQRGYLHSTAIIVAHKAFDGSIGLIVWLGLVTHQLRNLTLIIKQQLIFVATCQYM